MFRYPATLLLLLLATIAPAAVAPQAGPPACVRFDGSDAATTAVTSRLAITSQQTIECWFRSVSTSPQALFLGRYQAHQPTPTITGGIQCTLGYGELSGGAFLGTWTGVFPQQGGADGQWHHCAQVVDGVQTWTYFDGVAYGPVTGSAPLITPNARILLAQHPDALPYAGDIAEVRAWNAALPGSVIAEWRGARVTPAHPFWPYLVAYYPMNDGVGTAAADVIHGDDAAFVGSPSWQPGLAFVTAQQNTPLTGTLSGSVSLGTIAFAIGTMPHNGTLSLDTTTGAYTYTPQAGVTGFDCFTYTVGDGFSTSEVTQVNIQIAPVTLLGAPLPTGYLRNLLHLGSQQSYIITGTQPGGPNIALDDFLWAGLGAEYLQQPQDGQLANLQVTTSETPMRWTNTIATRTDGVWDDGYGGNYYREYYAITLVVPSTRQAQIAYWIDDRARVWMDGNPTPVLQVDANASGSSPTFTLPIGVHHFVCKYEQLTSSSVFAIRFTDTSGADMTDLNYTLADVVPPSVVSVSPADGSSGAVSTTSVQIAFSEPMDTTAPPSSIASLTGGTVAGSWAWTDPLHLTWTGSSPLDEGTTYSVRCSATDRAGNALVIPYVCAFTTVTNVTPSFTAGVDQTVPEDSPAQTVTGWATAISAGPPSESSQTVGFIVSVDQPALFSVQPAISAAGDLTYTPARYARGSAVVTVQIHDSGGTAGGAVDTSLAQTFTITLTPVDHAPVALDGSISLVEDTSVSATLAATDIENDPLTFALHTPAAHGSVVIIGGTATYAPVAGYVGVDAFSYLANDGTLDSNVATVSITVVSSSTSTSTTTSTTGATPPAPASSGSGHGCGLGGGLAAIVGAGLLARLCRRRFRP
jgi:hypothetical protein